MLSDFQNELSRNAGKAAGACARYKIKVSYGERICVHEVVTEDCGGLSLLPGTVSDDNGCLGKTADIIVPPCVSNITERVPLRLEKLRQTICANSGKGSRQSGDCGGYMSDCIWTSTTKHTTVSSARIGDTVAYTVTFTNHSLVTLDMVRIFDVIPVGVTVAPDSIRPTPRPGETLQTGISMGSIAAGRSVTLKYSVTVNPGASGCIKNCAHAEYCYIDCKGCCRRGIGSRRSCVIKIIPCDIKIAVAKSADKYSVCSVCERITYTLIVSNPGDVALTGVTVCDSIPQGLCYMACSTRRNGGMPADENPKNGVFIGTLDPGESYAITFILIVCARPYCEGIPAKFVNTARARGSYGKTTVSDTSDPWIVAMNGKCLFECVQKSVSIDDFRCLRDCFIYHTGVNRFDSNLGHVLRAGYGIKIKYVDCNGEKKSKCFEGSVLFILPGDVDATCFTVRFTDLNFRIDYCGNIIIGFNAILCYCMGNTMQ